MTGRKVERIVVVIPALNEHLAIEKVLRDVVGHLKDYQVATLVVDGGSTDGTPEIARRAGARVIQQTGLGYGDALQDGLNYASKRLNASILVIMDADGTYKGKDLKALLEPIINRHADLVLGNRFPRLTTGAMKFPNRLGNKLLSKAAAWVLGIRISDTQTGFRAMRRELWRQLDMKSVGMPFAIEMLAEAREAGCNITEVPVEYGVRMGESKLSPSRDGISIFAAILRLTRDYQPLLFFGGVGTMLIVGGAAIGVSVVIEWLRTGIITRLASVVLSSTLIIGGALILVLGLVADMVRDVKRFLRKSAALE